MKLSPRFSKMSIQTIRYEHIGIEVTFKGRDWSDSANPIDHIKLFKGTKEQTECTMCLKRLKGENA